MIVNNQYTNQYNANYPNYHTIKSLQDNNYQLPLYGFVFMAGLVVGSILIQSLVKK